VPGRCLESDLAAELLEALAQARQAVAGDELRYAAPVVAGVEPHAGLVDDDADREVVRARVSERVGGARSSTVSSTVGPAAMSSRRVGSRSVVPTRSSPTARTARR
jgi:hypothetical protein